MNTGRALTSAYLHGVAVPDYDLKVSIKLKSFKPFADGEPWVIAIENEAGQIYRVVTVYGLSDYMSMINKLTTLGFDDIYAENEQPVNGYDSRLKRVA